MQTLVYIVGILGNIISILVFLAPVKTFWRVVKNRSTEDFDSLPYICTFLNACLWIYYGLIKPGGILLATVNIAGNVFEFIYITLFLIYAPPRAKVKTAWLVAVVDVLAFVVVVLITQLAMHGELRISVVGFITAAMNILFYGSPLGIMKTVITTKSVEYMPFLLSFFIFINGAVWTFYSYLTLDVFVAVPNGIGFLLGTAQLILYAIYMNTKESKGQTRGIENSEEPLIQPGKAPEADLEKAYDEGSNSYERIPT